MRRKLLLLTAIVAVLAMVVALSAGCGNKKPTTEDKPVVSRVVPESGPAGTQIKIIGGEFGSTQGNSVVHVGTKEAEVSSWEDGLIAATVPDGLDPTTQPVTVMTDKGESDYIEFTVVEKPSDQPDPKERHVETVSAEQAMINWLKQKGVDTTGWTYTVVNISEKDGNWKIDKASKAGQADSFFLFHKDAKGNWVILDDGNALTQAELQADGAPSDLYKPPPPPPPKQVSQIDAVKAYVQKQGGNPNNVYLSITRISTIDPSWQEGIVATNPGGQPQDVVLHKVSGNWTVVFMGNNPTHDQLVQLGVPKDLAHSNTEAQAIATWIQSGHAEPGVTSTGWTLKVVKSSKADPDWEIVSGTQAGYQSTMYWLLHWEGNQWVVKDDGGTLTQQDLNSPGMPNDLF